MSRKKEFKYYYNRYAIPLKEIAKSLSYRVARRSDDEDYFQQGFLRVLKFYNNDYEKLENAYSYVLKSAKRFMADMGRETGKKTKDPYKDYYKNYQDPKTLSINTIAPEYDDYINYEKEDKSNLKPELISKRNDFDDIELKIYLKDSIKDKQKLGAVLGLLGGFTKKEIAREYRVARKTVYNWFKELRKILNREYFYKHETPHSNPEYEYPKQILNCIDCLKSQRSCKTCIIPEIAGTQKQYIGYCKECKNHNLCTACKLGKLEKYNKNQLENETRLWTLFKQNPTSYNRGRNKKITFVEWWHDMKMGRVIAFNEPTNFDFLSYKKQLEIRTQNAKKEDRLFEIKEDSNNRGTDKKFYQEVKRLNPTVKWSKRYRDNILQKYNIDLWG